MFLCYADESGYNGKKLNPKQPVQVMAGIFPNAYNFHRSDSEFLEVFNIIKAQIPVSELKGEQIYRGRGSWQGVQNEKRDNVIEFYLQWIASRNHKFIVSALDNVAYFDFRASNPDNPFIQKIPFPYILAGLQIALTIQKLNRSKKNNKGKTILIFDNQDDDLAEYLSNLIFSPPDFIDEYVDFDEKREKTRLCQIVDTAFFVNSHHSSMTQVVDIVAYLFRLYLELHHYGLPEAYAGEKNKISRWIGKIQNKFVPFNILYPKGKQPFIQFINTMKAKGV